MSIIYQGSITNIEAKNHWEKNKEESKPTKLTVLEFNSLAFDVIHILTKEDLVTIRNKIIKRLKQYGEKLN